MVWSQFGPWIWHDKFQRYYRQRQDQNGTRETQWAPDQQPTEHPVSRGHEHSQYAQQYPPQPSGYPVSPDHQGGYSQQADNPYAYQTTDPYAHQSTDPYAHQTTDPYIATSGPPVEPYAQSTYEHEQYAPIVASSHTVDEGPSGSPADPPEKRRRRKRRRGKKSSLKHQPSSSGSEPDPSVPSETDSESYPRPGGSPTYSPRLVDPHHNYYHDPTDPVDPTNPPYLIDSGEGMLHVEPIPPVSTPVPSTIDTADTLDPRYRVHRSDAFQPGSVFKTLWSEPIGKTTTTESSIPVSDTRTFIDNYGEKFYVGFRRFIVVANDAGHCTCVPILTYGGRGCCKRGVKADRHGVVYQAGHRARMLPDEPQLGFPPIKIEISVRGERLTAESRVNYSKLVTIEHNVKVFFVGMVSHDDAELMHDAVDKCWRLKSFHRRERM